MSRPLLQLGQILGQDSVLDALRQSAARKTLHHALLFVGPEGVGKRTTALALAAWLHCRAGGDDACGTCAACAQVAAGTHPDLRRESLPLDERGEPRERMLIEQVRAVRLFLAGQALGGGRKIAIFEEAQSLTEDAQNALLKILEEPPRRSLLVLVCHNASRLLSTVRSRCQRVTFVPLATPVVERCLRERLGKSAEDARFLALHADGSLHLAANAGRLREAHERAAAFLSACSGNYADVVSAVRELFGSGRGLPLEAKLLLGRLRSELRARVGLPSPELTRLSKTGTLTDALRAAEAAYAAVVDLGRNANRSLTAERMALRIGAARS